MVNTMATAPRATDDAALLARLATKDAAAFTTLYDRHVGYVIAAASRLLANREEAEEVAQELFRHIWEGDIRYDPARGRFTTWLFAVARNRAIDRIRNGSRRAALSDALTGTEEPTSRSAEALTGDAERRAHVRAAMKDLSAEQRSALEVCFFRGLTHRAAAEHFGVPLGTLKSRVKTAMDKLRENLSGLRDES